MPIPEGDLDWAFAALQPTPPQRARTCKGLAGVRVQAASILEGFLRDFQGKNPSGTTKIPSRSDLEWGFSLVTIHTLDRVCIVTSRQDTFRLCPLNSGDSAVFMIIWTEGPGSGSRLFICSLSCKRSGLYTALNVYSPPCGQPELK